MTQYIVEMRHVTKTFPGIRANDDVSIAIKRGEVYALLGENGAGKSTLLKVLNGDYQPTSGEYWLDGQQKRFSSPQRGYGERR